MLWDLHLLKTLCLFLLPMKFKLLSELIQSTIRGLNMMAEYGTSFKAIRSQEHLVLAAALIDSLTLTKQSCKSALLVLECNFQIHHSQRHSCNRCMPKTEKVCNFVSLSCLVQLMYIISLPSKTVLFQTINSNTVETNEGAACWKRSSMVCTTSQYSDRGWQPKVEG